MAFPRSLSVLLSMIYNNLNVLALANICSLKSNTIFSRIIAIKALDGVRIGIALQCCVHFQIELSRNNEQKR